MKNLVTFSATASFTWGPLQLQNRGSLCCWSHKENIAVAVINCFIMTLMDRVEGNQNYNNCVCVHACVYKKSVLELSSVMHLNGFMSSVFKLWKS